MNQFKENFSIFFQKNLNTNQQAAASPLNGILLVKAGAGSGKTRVITARVANLIINYQIPAYAIIALTFTNKAAREMRERIKNFIGSENSYPYVGTFHSYCLRLLKSNPMLINFPNFSILDESDKEKIIRQILIKSNLQKKITPKQLINYISRIKNEENNNNFYNSDPLMQELFLAYEKEKKFAQSYDFDDLLHEVLNLFKTNKNFKEKFQAQVRHILIDEYQDTNSVQHALLKQMAHNENKTFALDSLCVVGDEDQSIYSWRGATVENIVEFKKDFPEVSIITIEQNYRSVQPILKIANNIIANNSYRTPKNLFSNKEATDSVRLLSLASGYQEAEALALLLKNIPEKNRLEDFAILYRSHYQSRMIEEALIRHNIPYKILGGTQFYDREEIKDLLYYMRLIVNPFDRVALMRVINCPNRGLGEKFQEEFYNLWDRNPFLNFKEIANLIITQEELTKTKKESLEIFLKLFNELNDQEKPSIALKYFIKNISYITYLQTSYEKDIAASKIENVKELLNSIIFSEEQNNKTISEFLEDIALLQEKIDSSDNNLEYVRLMTLHAAKGLEFHTVILCGLEEGTIPSAHSRNSSEAIEEERRLLYVGITRACERLLITHARYRYIYGQMNEQEPSRFISELDMRYINHDDASYWDAQEFSRYFIEWLNFPKEFIPERLEEFTVNSKLKTKNIKLEPESILIQSSSKNITQKIPNFLDKNLDKNFNRNSSKNSISEPNYTSFKLYQNVEHKTFGNGIIESIETKKNGKSYLIIKFSSGVKKISPEFITSI